MHRIIMASPTHIPRIPKKHPAELEIITDPVESAKAAGPASIQFFLDSAHPTAPVIFLDPTSGDEPPAW